MNASIASIRDDTEHGAAFLSIRALEVLRKRAAQGRAQVEEGRTDAADAEEVLRQAARRLLEARPSMAAVGNRLARALAAADALTPEAVERAAQEAIRAAHADDEAAARHAARAVAGRCVLTLSRSGTVRRALRRAEPPPKHVVVAHSHPPGEGEGVAEALAEAGLSVALVPDAALAWALEEWSVDLVLTGADAVLPSGAVVNKTGTRLAALAARDAGVPFRAACAAGKIRPDADAPTEEGPPGALYDGDVPVQVRNPVFERTPARLVGGVITERGRLGPKEIAAVAETLRARREQAEALLRR